jgi:rod shape determining protein RodA
MNRVALNESRLRFDALQLLAVIGLGVLSVLFVYSAKMVNEPVGLVAMFRETSFVQFLGWLTHQLFFRQIIWVVLGLLAAAGLCWFNYQSLSRWSFVAYWAGIGALIAVLIPGIGSVHGGARRWIDFGVFQFQPSEFAKLAFIAAMGHFLSRPAEELRSPKVFWQGIGLMVLPFVLTLKEPDLGSALMFLSTGSVMLFVAGAPRRYLLWLGSAGFLVISLIVADVLFLPPDSKFAIRLQEYQRQRLLVYFGKDFVPKNATPAQIAEARQLQKDKSHQGRQALISVGSGGLLGKGWGQGDQTRLGFLPRDAAHTDFIFSVIAEEEGFVGSLLVLTLYAVVLFSGIRIAGQARDRLGKLVATGVVTLLFSHVFINIGMNIRMMPVTGVPLPLLSYGGSAVLCSLIAIGILQNIHIHRKGY